MAFTDGYGVYRKQNTFIKIFHMKKEYITKTRPFKKLILIASFGVLITAVGASRGMEVPDTNGAGFQPIPIANPIMQCLTKHSKVNNRGFRLYYLKNCSPRDRYFLVR